MNNSMKFTSGSVLKIAAVSWIICFAVYFRALFCGFVNYDDSEYVLHNILIRDLNLDFLKFVFTSSYAGSWMPLTWISFAIDYRLWEMNAFGYHLTNILLHSTNTFVVVLIADKVLGKKYCDIQNIQPYLAMLLLSGLFFGIHPLRVESVVWISERKDVLNGLFALGSVLFYLMYAQAKDIEGKSRLAANYSISLMLFALSLMAKSITVVMPALLIIIDWFPLKRLRKTTILTIIYEKIPFLLLSLAVSVLTIYYAQTDGMFLTLNEISFYKRLLISGNSVFEYLRLIIFPVGIQPFYIINPVLPASYAIKAVVVVAVCCSSLYFIKSRPWIPALWFLFLTPLLPVLAFFQNGGEEAMAARFTYLPAVPISVIAAFGFFQVYRYQNKLRVLLCVTILFLLLFYATVTYRDTIVWDNTGTLWTRLLEVQEIGRAYVQRGMYYYSIGHYDEAIQDLSRAIEIAKREKVPVLHNLYAFRGDSYRAMKSYDKALEDLTSAIEITPNPSCNYLRGLTLKSMGRQHEAEKDFELAGEHPIPLDWY
ncbi:MAG: tetratricopeptide repeat protein [Desulfuromonadaceae bacterium]|nr:tetratricopeptide repeat protein [Desulfuromonadaceae bacterium]MDD2855379.1 tetratricopeptide repeat protein [Desulfuromonadaceae bacterium]